MDKKILLTICIIFLTSLAGKTMSIAYETCNLGYQHFKHRHNEASYQKAWCLAQNGIIEYKNKDNTRVDCLTEYNAVEFDFSNKWAESIGQALHYGIMTNKKAKVILIIDNPEIQMTYFERIQKLADIYNFEAEYVTDEILNLTPEGKCLNPKCKCQKKPNSVIKISHNLQKGLKLWLMQ